MKYLRKAGIYIVMLLTAILLSGCASLDVSHLERRPWKLNSLEKVSMEFMKFEYEVVPRKGSFGLRGTAVIKENSVPVWASWISELWIQGYLSDADGNVLATGLQVFSPCRLDKSSPKIFDFELKPESLNPGPLFVSFGYRLVLQRSRSDADEPFMAIERAITH